MVYEGTKILSEQIALKPSDIDVVFTNGYGFPKERRSNETSDMIGLDKILKNIKNIQKKTQDFELLRNTRDLVNKTKNLTFKLKFNYLYYIVGSGLTLTTNFPKFLPFNNL